LFTNPLVEHSLRFPTLKYNAKLKVLWCGDFYMPKKIIVHTSTFFYESERKTSKEEENLDKKLCFAEERRDKGKKQVAKMFLVRMTD